MYDNGTIFIIGDAKASQNNPITKNFSQFFLAFVINPDDGTIADVDCSATVDLTKRFVHSLFIGRNILDDSILEEVNRRYFGSSQKALIVAFQNAQIKYKQIKTALSN